MKALVLYDSQYGNTAKVAEAMGQALTARGEVEVLRVAEASAAHVQGVDLVIAGSPTQKFGPTPAVRNLIKGLPSGALVGVRVAAFDTRFTEEKIDEIRILAFFVRRFGYAAAKIARRLEGKGGVRAAPPEGFYVADTEGPLLEGELERAAAWAAALA